jgi:hypothetical protein
VTELYSFSYLSFFMDEVSEEFVQRIKSYEKYPFHISDHARLRAKQRNISLEKVIEDILSNTNLINAEKQGKDKFLLSYQKKRQAKYQYVIELERDKIILVSLWKINNKIQKLIAKKWKKK